MTKCLPEVFGQESIQYWIHTAGIQKERKMSHYVRLLCHVRILFTRAIIGNNPIKQPKKKKKRIKLGPALTL